VAARIRKIAFVGSRQYPMTAAQAEELKISDFGEWAKAIQDGKKIVERWVDLVKENSPKRVMIISGGAGGPDTWAVEYAESLGLETKVFKAEWEKYGKSAGFKRNKLIVEAADEVIAFWDLDSRGTDNSIAHAFRLQKPLIVVGPDGHPTFGAGEDDYAEIRSLRQPKKEEKMEVPRG